MNLEKRLYLAELAYKGNVGFQEMVTFYRTATYKEIEEMESIISNDDWTGFRKLIKKVLNVNLV